MFLVLDEFRFSLFDMFTNSPCDGRCLSIFSVKTLIISVLFLLYSLRYFNWSLSSLISDSLLLNGFAKAYFRRRAEARRAEIISARPGSAWHASVLDEENIAVLKELY